MTGILLALLLTTDTPSVHILRPGDQVLVVVKDQREEMKINPDGEVFLRGLGAVPFVSKTSAEAQRDLHARITAAGYPVVETEVAVFLVTAAPDPPPPPTPPAPREVPLTADSGVTVLGEVSKPGIHPPGRLTEILAHAGGTTSQAASRLVLRLPDGTSKRIHLAQVLAGRAPDEEIPPGAVLHAPRAFNFFEFLGTILGLTRTATGVAR